MEKDFTNQYFWKEYEYQNQRRIDINASNHHVLAIIASYFVAHFFVIERATHMSEYKFFPPLFIFWTISFIILIFALRKYVSANMPREKFRSLANAQTMAEYFDSLFDEMVESKDDSVIRKDVIKYLIDAADHNGRLNDLSADSYYEAKRALAYSLGPFFLACIFLFTSRLSENGWLTGTGASG